jgi:5-methyltetrahydropteroyltriglutamate--homocysteine methyltransferase
MLHFRAGRAGIPEDVYPDMQLFYDDVAAAYRDEIADLTQAGCRYIQFDDTNLAYLCDTGHRQDASNRGMDPDSITHEYARLINASFAGAPADMVKAMHLCRGNFRSSWAAEGGYEPVAEVMFNECDIDAFFLEYDDARSGDFAPLRFLPKGKTVVLGLVSTKLGELESKDQIKRRIDEAAKFVAIEQLALSPQCGFASTVHGNDITTEQQAEKIRLVVEVAEDVWGNVPAMAD